MERASLHEICIWLPLCPLNYVPGRLQIYKKNQKRRFSLEKSGIQKMDGMKDLNIYDLRSAVKQI